MVPTYTYYGGDAGVGREIATIGGVALDLDATVHAVSVPILYQSPLELFGGHYAAGLILPYVDVETTGTLTIGELPPLKRRDTARGLGDIAVMPFIVGWVKGDWKYDARLVVYTPTGDYDKDSLANVGKNYWTVEPVFSLSYLGSKTGRQFTAFAGLDFNGTNSDTDYTTGTQFHLDVTLAQHFPLGKGLAGIGANAFYYEQLGGDSGSGAILGDFKGRTMGIGPTLSYVTKISDRTDLVTELKWLPELDVKHRLEGDYVWLKVVFLF